MTVRIEDLRQEGKTKSTISFRVGQTVRVHKKIKEGDKERVQIFNGLVIGLRNAKSLSAAITVRKIIGGIGVEQVFPIHSPLVLKIELVKEAKVRRGKLYFMRTLRGKAARLKERFFTEEELLSLQPHNLTEEEIAEAVAHEKAEQEALTQVETRDTTEDATEVSPVEDSTFEAGETSDDEVIKKQAQDS